MNPFKQYTAVDDFTSALYINNGHIEFVIKYDGVILLDDENTNGLLYVVKNRWQSQCWLKDISTPYMIWTGCCGPIEPLDSNKLNSSIIENFKQYGLTFILYEPLSTYRSEIKNQFVDHLNYDQFESDETNLNNLYSYELDSIQMFAERINFQGQVTVITCHYKIQQHFQQKYPNLDLQCRDIFVSTDSFTEHTYSNLWPFKIPHKRFICLNRRYTGIRHMAMLYLASTNHFHTGTYSWNINTHIGYINQKLWFDFDSWRQRYPKYFWKIHDAVEKLNDVVPLTLDEQIPKPYFIGDPERKDPPASACRTPKFAYSEAFAAIITETRFADPMANFSEKTTNAIKAHRPFVLFAPPCSLEYLHKLGFKTFGEFWDESYDQELNHELRLLKIFDVIDHIDNMTYYDVKHTLDKMRPILEHNAEVLSHLSYNFPILY